MNNRYGVDPATPMSRRDLADLVRLFDPAEGRFIIGFPDEWVSRLRKHVEGWSDLDRKSAEEALRILRRMLMPSGLRYDDRKKWAENASLLKSRESIRGLIGPSGSPATVDALPDLMERIPPLPSDREALIERSVESYLAAIDPILRTSPKVLMIDRYFGLHDHRGGIGLRYKVLDSFLSAADRCNVRAFHLVVEPAKAYAAWDPSGEDYCAVLDALRSNFRRVEIVFSPRSDCGHARYFLGNYSGLQFDYGFDVDRSRRSSVKQDKNHVHWLTDGVLRQLHDEYG